MNGRVSLSIKNTQFHIVLSVVKTPRGEISKKSQRNKTYKQQSFFVVDSYPKSVPQVMIQSKIMHGDQVDELKELLLSKAKSLTGTNMLKNLIENAMKWITEQGLCFVMCKSSLRIG